MSELGVVTNNYFVVFHLDVPKNVRVKIVPHMKGGMKLSYHVRPHCPPQHSHESHQAWRALIELLGS